MKPGMLRLCAVLLVAAVLSGGTCRKNRPPAVPQLAGPNIGKPGSSLTFSVASADPEGHEIAYEISWGDTSEVVWTSTYASGQPVMRTHAYPDSGVYYVKAKARDEQDAESDWSESIAVTVGYLPPNRPQRPSGPAVCTTTVRYTFAVKTTHPLGDSVYVQFDWGEELGNWEGPVASDSEFQTQHTFDSAGTFSVMARAQDSRGSVSAWSEPLTVTVHRAIIFPMTVGSTWNAEMSMLKITWPAPPDTIQSGTSVCTVVKQDTLGNGKDVVQFRCESTIHVRIPDTTITDTSYWYVGEEKEYILRYESLEDSTGDTLMTTSPSVGKGWYSSGGTVKYGVTGREDVTVKAGTYRGAWKVKRTTDTLETFVWYAVGAGNVKTHYEKIDVGTAEVFSQEVTAVDIR